MNKNKHIGSSLDSFLDEDGLLEQVEEVAVKRVLAYQLDEARKDQKMSKKQMAKEMKVSDTQLLRLFDPKNGGITLRTMTRAAGVLGMKVEINLVRDTKVRA